MTSTRVVCAGIVSLAMAANVAATDIAVRNWSVPSSWSPPAASNGRLEATADRTNPLPFVAITPCRAYDSRVSNGGAGPLEAHVSRTIDLDGSTCGPFPPTLGAYSVSITVFGSPVGPFHFFTAYPAGTVRPNVSTLNFAGGAQVTSAAVVPASSYGDVDVYATTSTEFVIDINGYYSRDQNPGRTLIVHSDSGTAIQGSSTEGTGIIGYSLNGYGVRAFSETGTGLRAGGFVGIWSYSRWQALYALSPRTGNGAVTGALGLVGTTPSAEGRLGYHLSGVDYAVYSAGNAHVQGTLTKSGGSFKIDHPTDPENKYLSHSFVESPDMKNIYDGNVVVDAEGRAVVQLPEYFNALNREFRYQLTPIGGFAELYIEQKIVGNQFVIAGGRPGMEVSWQVTGVRRDPWAEKNRIKVEEMKRDEDRGRYMDPSVYDQPASKAIGLREDAAGERPEASVPVP